MKIYAKHYIKSEFVHCHNCDWSQDDFPSKSYTPNPKRMYWKTYEEYEKDPNHICPKCKQRSLDID